MERIPIPVPEKKTSGVDRIVGVNSEDEKGIKEYFADLFKEEKAREFFLEPDQEVQEIFPRLNEDLRNFLRGFGVEPADTPFSMVVILDKEKLPPEQKEYLRKRKTGAFYQSRLQVIVMLEDWKEGGRLGFLQRLAHEMIHVQAFESWQNLPEERKGQTDLVLGKEGREVRLAPRRTGFNLVGRDGKTEYFHDIDEAITEELAMRFEWEYFHKYPELFQEISERNEALEALVARNGSSIEEERRNLAEIRKHAENGGMRVELRGYPYDKERGRLMDLCSDIYQKNMKQLSSPEDVFKIFTKAAMTGRLLPVARLIESVYGKGTFRSLGESTARSENSDIG